MLKKLSVLALMVGLMSITPSISVAAPPPNHCPNIHRAVGALEAAMHDMEVAGHDFCGHKADAMEATRRALEQLRRAEACDPCR